MRKTIRFEIEVTLDESAERRAIEVAREHYREMGQATAPLDDKGDRWRKISPEEFIPDAETAVMELIKVNDLLQKTGVEVTAVSGPELHRAKARRHGARQVRLQDDARLRGEPDVGKEEDMDEFETGVYLCRWPN